jgi:outer membrane receptor protein involved in Fe transport
VSYDASYLVSEVKLDENYGNDLSRTRLLLASDVITDRLSGKPACRSALTGEDPSCVPWNPFAAGGVTPAAAAYIEEPASLGATIKQRVATATATIALDTWGIGSPWSDEEAIINVGAEYRKDSVDIHPDEAFQSGDLAGQGQPLIPFNGATRVKELFGEGRFPLLTHRLVYELALEVGYRRSWHSDGTHDLSTDSYKVAVDVSPIRGIRLRASQQRAVRAPNIQELFSPDVQDSFDSDPCAGISPSATQQQCAFTGVTAGQYGKILANPAQAFGGYNSIIGGNRSLGPERSRTRSIGVVIEPKFLSPLNVTVDWYDITLKGAIEEIGAQTIMDTCIATGDRLFCNRIHRDAQGSLWLNPQGYIDNTNANIGGLRVRGVDASANYTRDLGRFGSASTEFIGSRLIRSVTDNGGLATPFNCSGLFGYPCSNPVPKWRHTLRVTWASVHGLSMSLNWRHVGGVTLAALRPEFGLTRLASPLETNIRPQNYFDVTATFRVKRQYVLRFGARNVLDRKPPLVTDANPACYTSIQGCSGNTFPQLYDPLGRYIFAGATLNFK